MIGAIKIRKLLKGILGKKNPVIILISFGLRHELLVLG